MTFWNKRDKTVSLKSKKYPEGKYIAAIRYSKSEDDISTMDLFINGKLVDSNSYAKGISHFSSPKYMIIGATR